MWLVVIDHFLMFSFSQAKSRGNGQKSFYHQSFEKEVCRFKAMEKEQYKFHGYVEQLTEEMTLLFEGTPDGMFELIIKPYNSTYRTFIKFTEKEMIENFKNLLEGKSANEEIDDIFKN